MNSVQTAILRITQQCESKGLSVNKMLSISGLHSNVLNSMKSRGTMPAADTIALIALTLQVSTDYILGLTDDPKPAVLSKSIVNYPQKENLNMDYFIFFKTKFAKYLETEIKFAASLWNYASDVDIPCEKIEKWLSKNYTYNDMPTKIEMGNMFHAPIDSLNNEVVKYWRHAVEENPQFEVAAAKETNLLKTQEPSDCAQSSFREDSEND